MAIVTGCRSGWLSLLTLLGGLLVVAPAEAQTSAFTLTNTGSVSVAAGTSGTTTIIATRNLSASPTLVGFSASGLPAGATAQFGNTPCTTTCSTGLTITTLPSTAPGSYTITVTGTSQFFESIPSTSSTPVTLVVLGPFDFTLASSSSVTVVAGSSGSTTITATLQTGQTRSVSFSASGLPAGATAQFGNSPCNPTCSTPLTIATLATTVPGSYTFTVTGTAPSGFEDPPLVTRTTPVTLVVLAPFNFAVASLSAVTATAGGSGTTTITATLQSGETQPVSFSASGLPIGATAQFAQPSCSPTCSSVLTITTAVSTPVGTFSFTVTGTSGGVAAGGPISRSTPVTLVVVATFDYTLANSGGVTVTAGGSGTTTITATLQAGQTQSVSFAASGLPPGAAALFAPTSCNPTCSSVLTIATATSTPAGTFTITVTGNPGARTTSFALVVNAVPVIAIVSGNNQVGVINSTLPQALVVSVTPANSTTTVNWVASGGASPPAISTQTVGGRAEIRLTLGPTPGSVTVTASVGGLNGAGSSVTFIVNDATQAAITGLKTFSVLGNLAITTTTVQSKNIGLRLAALRRGGGGGVSISGLSLNVAGQSVPLEAVTSFLTSGPGGGASADPPSIFKGLGIFLNGQGSFGEQDVTSREPGFTFHTEGLTLGTDYRVTDNVVLGAAIGYLRTKADLDDGGGRVKTDGYSVSLFGSYYVTDKMYVDAIATYGWNGYGVTRNTTFADTSATARSDPDGNQFALSVSGGYNLNFGPLTAGPTAKITYIRVHIDGFEERGADIFNLRVNSQKVESLTTDLGGQISYAISTPWGVLLPQARAEWVHEFRGGSRLITGGLVADTLRTNFSAPTNSPDRNYVNLGAGMTATLPRGVSGFANYETVLGRDHVVNHAFTAGLRFQFD
jgi:outer membrane lipase/esterase